MVANETLNIIMTKCRISNVLLSEITNINVSTICRYRKNQRNIGRKNFDKIHNALIELDVSSNNIKELRYEYENSRNKKVL